MGCNTKIGVRGMGWEDVDLIEMAYERAFVSRIMNTRVP